ncbi:MAG TPA: hypothetical protein VGR62_04775 [Candidatus Binatia bacterium]|nr:hypothetical protein [Candidatus Binatia bacterium]
MFVRSTMSDFDWGYTGGKHNYGLWDGARLTACLSSCDDVADPVCDAVACTARPLPPLGLSANGLPVCLVLHVEEGTQRGTFDLASGALSLPVTLRADVPVQTPVEDVCPRCSGEAVGTRGTCNSGQRQGESCTVEAEMNVPGPNPHYFVSADCPPDARKLVASIPFAMTLTTGETALAGSHPCPGQTINDACGMGTCTVDCSDHIATKGGINQTCCSNDPATPCFPTAADSSGTILRNGVAMSPTPAWPTPAPSRSATGAVLAGIFCSPSVPDASVNILYGLPGPGALLLPVDMDVHG